MKDYKKLIEELASKLDKDFIDIRGSRKIPSKPSQVSSEFITNKQQGDWAEEVILQAINGLSNDYVAVKYGKSDDLIAGEEGFDKLYEDYQQELELIGKRPDILIFNRKDFIPEYGYDISKWNISPELDKYISQALAGVEVRSSSFLIDKYNEVNNRITEEAIKNSFLIRDEILNNYSDLLLSKCNALIPLLSNLSIDNIGVFNFQYRTWSSNDRLRELSKLLSQLKKELKIVHRRDTLSITPKVEDLKTVYKWIMHYGVPHFYVQVFFDKIFGVSFLDILRMLSSTESLEGVKYTVEKDVKNQGKRTVKIPVKESICIAQRVEEPHHRSKRKELKKGRLLFYVTFTGGNAYLDWDGFQQLFDFEKNE